MVAQTPAGIGTIIILNGTSSSGKTSILKAVQNQMETPYLDAGIDRFIFGMPERYLDRPLWDDVLGQADRAGTTGQLLFHGMHRAIFALAQSGVSVVADHVLVEPAWLDDCANLFAGLPAYLIAIHCPLEELERRERARKNRTLGQAHLQYPLVHARAVYDLELDTSIHSPEECARMICGRVRCGNPQAFIQLKNRLAVALQENEK